MKVVIKESIKEAKTVAEAMQKAFAELGEYGDNVKTEVLVEPSKGFLGFGSRLAKVRAFIEEEREEPVVVETKAAAPAAVVSGISKEEAAVAYIKEVLTAMGVENFSVNATKEGENLNIALEGEDLGFVIGRRGETLDALQYLTSLYVNRGQEGYTRVTLDTENYRAKREEALRRLANRMANRAVKTGRKVVMEPMNPYERRILHSALQGNDAVTTHSEGDEPNRHVVITLK